MSMIVSVIENELTVGGVESEGVGGTVGEGVAVEGDTALASQTDFQKGL